MKQKPKFAVENQNDITPNDLKKVDRTFLNICSYYNTPINQMVKRSQHNMKQNSKRKTTKFEEQKPFEWQWEEEEEEETKLQWSWNFSYQIKIKGWLWMEFEPLKSNLYHEWMKKLWTF